MDPQLGRHAFNLAFYFTFMSAILIPFLRRDSPEFVAAVLAFIFSLLFLLVVSWEVRREASIHRTIPANEG
ncbi:MAG: hypothetical protein QW407_03140 [Thermofilaceae archaeon]|uniref:hypothetical protein n=1 Tax=Thermofilum sp. TaxID=1961369 RepID=UPI0031641D6E